MAAVFEKIFNQKFPETLGFLKYHLKLSELYYFNNDQGSPRILLILAFHLVFNILFALSQILGTITDADGYFMPADSYSLTLFSSWTRVAFIFFALKPKLTVIDKILKKVNNIAELKEAYRQCRKFFKFYLIFLFVTYGLFSLIPLIVMKKMFIIQMWTPYNWKDSMSAFLLSVIYQFLSESVQILQVTIADTYPTICMYFLQTHVRILGNQFARIGWRESNQVDNEKELIRCIKSHKELLR